MLGNLEMKKIVVYRLFPIGESPIAYIKTLICRYSLTVRISACHAEGVGSIPITCSSAVAGQRRVQKAT